ncbi:MAG: tetratricopeptide repeat protein [Saprospiraceae bacterium]|nr:tetratricopeptide repeat protein [Saprospiraceae bacterium]
MFLSLASACKNTPQPDQTAVLEQSLRQLDQEMTAANGTVADSAKANAFIKTAEEYAALVQTTQPEKYADLLLKAAGVAKSIGNSAKALELYTAVTDKMPQHPKAPMALFMQGFILENDRGDTAAARVKYQDFLKKYPNDSDFADDAQNALKYLGKSPEEMIREFEKMNK